MTCCVLLGGNSSLQSSCRCSWPAGATCRKKTGHAAQSPKGQPASSHAFCQSATVGAHKVSCCIKSSFGSSLVIQRAIWMAGCVSRDAPLTRQAQTAWQKALQEWSWCKLFPHARVVAQTCVLCVSCHTFCVSVCRKLVDLTVTHQ